MKKFLAILFLALIACAAVEENFDLKDWTDNLSREEMYFVIWLYRFPPRARYFFDQIMVSLESGIAYCINNYKSENCEAIVTKIYHELEKDSV